MHAATDTDTETDDISHHSKIPLLLFTKARGIKSILGSLINLRQKKKNCLVGVTRPTLFWVPTLDIFIFYFHVEMTKNNENEALY